MDIYKTGWVGERMEELYKTLSETDDEYALAVRRRQELSTKIQPIVMSKKEITLDVCNCLDIKEYCDQMLIISSIEHKFFYIQGYRDCVQLLKSLGVF